MANPFVPVLVSPAVRGAGDGAAAIAFTFQYNHPDAGVAGNAYFFRRRVMTPSIGSYEYWNGTIWTTSTANALAMTPGVNYIVNLTGWTNGNVYQWSVQTRDASNNLSGYAPDRLIDVHAKPAPTITQPTGAQSFSTPKMVWNWVSAASKKQRSYQLMIYRSTVYGDGAFNPALASWQALADYKMLRQYISSTDWFKYPDGFVIAPSITYKVYGEFFDEAGLSSGWVAGPTFTSSVTLPPAPSFVVTPRPTLGYVELSLANASNLLTFPQADFSDAGLGTWISTQNANLFPSAGADPTFNGPNSMKIRVGGLTYAELDTAQTTFTAETAAYTTFDNMKGTQAATAGVAKWQTPAGTSGVPVLPSTVYSGLANLWPMAAGHQARVNIKWWTAAGAAASTAINSGVLAAISVGQWNVVKLENVTSPANAAFASLEVEINSADVGDILYQDANVLKAGATIVWSAPTGGNIAYVVERSVDSGLTWTELWGCGRASPLNPGNGSGNVTVKDRDVPLNGGDVQYRAFQQTGVNPDFALSDPVLGTAAALDSLLWWIRIVDDDSYDTPLASAQRGRSYTPEMEVLKPLSSEDRLFLVGNVPDDESLRLHAWCKDLATYENTVAIIKSKKAIVVQTNRHGETWYGYCPGGFSDDQMRAVTDESDQHTRSLFTLDFTLELVGRPEI